MRALRLSLVSLFVSLCLLPSAWAQVLVEQEVFLNTRVSGALVRLEAFIVKMKDAPSQRLPIALITHGKPPSEGRVSDMRARLYAPQARDFARRGYLAVVVMRRGFGRSDGPSPVGVTCGSEDFGRNFEAAADDIESALAIIAQRSDADPDRIVAIGASAGGAAVLTLAARNPKGLRGVINVSGGLQIDNCSKDQLLIEPIAASGAKARVKTLWIYAENDNLFPPAIVDKMHEAWLARGGDVRRVRLPAQSSNGHTIFNTLTGRRAWLTEADAFLRDTGLPTWTQAHVRELLKDLKFKPEQGAGAERYLTAPGEKALARSKTSNRTSFQFGGPDLAQAHQRALQQCESREPKETCEIVAENNILLSSGRWLLAPASERSETPQSAD